MTCAGFEVVQCQGSGPGNQPRDVYAPSALINTVGRAVVAYKEEVVSRCKPGIQRFPAQQVADERRVGFGAGWSSQGMTSSPTCPNACAGPVTRSTASPAKAAPPLFARVR